MIQRGRMRPSGQRMIEQARQNGSWDVLAEAQNGIMPPDLQALLEASPQALMHFQGFPPSSKGRILEWIAAAKRPDTRQRRVARTVEMAENKLRANHPDNPR